MIKVACNNLLDRIGSSNVAIRLRDMAAAARLETCVGSIPLLKRRPVYCRRRYIHQQDDWAARLYAC